LLLAPALKADPIWRFHLCTSSGFAVTSTRYTGLSGTATVGYVWPVGDGKWFYSTTYGWLGVNQALMVVKGA